MIKWFYERNKVDIEMDLILPYQSSVYCDHSLLPFEGEYQCVEELFEMANRTACFVSRCDDVKIVCDCYDRRFVN